MRRGALAPVLGLGLTLVTLTACGGGSSAISAAPSASTGGVVTTSTPSTDSSSASTDSSSPSNAPTASSNAAATPTPQATPTAGRSDRCHTSELAATDDGIYDGAAGRVFGSVTVRNTSSSSCTLYGYPGLLMLDARGHALPTRVGRDNSHGGSKLIALAPQQQGSFVYSYSHVPSGNETSCAQASRLEVTPPDETDHLIVRSQVSPCNSGTIDVQPLRTGKASAGTSG